MEYIYKKYGVLSESLKFFVTSIANYNVLSINEKCEILLSLFVLNIPEHYLIDKLNEISKYNAEHENLVTQLKRHIVLIKYDMNLDERIQFIKYWLEDEFYKKEDIVGKSWIFGILTDDLQLIESHYQEKIRNWFMENSEKINSSISLSWFPLHLEKHSQFERAQLVSDIVLAQTERNGSWGGNVSRTARILYALSMSKSSKGAYFEKSFSFIENRLHKGVDLNTKLSSLLIKLYFVSGKIEMDFVELLEKEISITSNSRMSTIKLCLSKNQIEEAFSILDSYWIESPNDLILLKSKYSMTIQSFNKGLISLDERNVGLQRINNSILELITNERKIT